MRLPSSPRRPSCPFLPGNPFGRVGAGAVHRPGVGRLVSHRDLSQLLSTVAVMVISRQRPHSDAALDDVRSCWPHAGPHAALIHELKYGRATSVVTELADALAEIAPPSDLVTWVPCSPSRRRQRGFDQSELLARAVAGRLGVRARRLLRRVDDDAQTARDLSARLEGPDFVSVGRRLRFSPTVLLVDDVLTTGATLRSAAAVVRDRGGARVVGLTVTRAGGGGAVDASTPVRSAV